MFATFAVLLVPAVPQLDGHSISHPAEASLYWEIASTADVQNAYRSSAWAELMRDKEIHGAIDALMESEDLSWAEMRTDFLDRARSEMPAVFDMEFLHDLRGSSVSLTVQGGDLGAWIARMFESGANRDEIFQTETHLRALFDFESEESAAAALEWAKKWTTGSPLEISTPRTAGNNQRIEMSIGSLETAGPKAKERLSLEERWHTLGAALGEPTGTTLVSFWNADGTGLTDRAEQWIPYSGLDGPYGQFQSTLLGAGLRMLSHGGAWRVTASNGEFRTVGLTPKRSNTAVDETFGARALSTKAMGLLHPDAVLGGVMTIEREALVEWMESLFERPEVQPYLQRLEELYGLDRKRHLLSPFGEAIGWSILGDFGLVAPTMILSCHLSDPAAAEEALAVLARWVVDEEPNAEVVQRTYKKFKTLTLRASKETQLLSPKVAAALQPTFAVVGNRLVVAMTRVQLKREIKRLQALGEEPPTLPFGLTTSKHWEGSSQVSFGDWMGILTRGYQVGKSVAPMIAGSDRVLPFDFALLPPAELFTRHFQPSVETHRGTPIGDFYESRSSVGPESNAVLLLAIGLIAYRTVPYILNRLDESKMKKVHADLAMLKSALTQVAINNGGRYPASLQALVDPNSKGQRYLRSKELPKDAWGNAYLYQANGSPLLWSAGPDGIDQSGTGDDITINDAVGD